MKHIKLILLVMILSLGVMAMSMTGKSKSEKLKIFDVRQDKVIGVSRVIKTDSEWKKILPPDVYDITVKQGTEAPGSCALINLKGAGIYECVRCGTDLFISGTKFDSGTGWPSFFEPTSSMNIKERSDLTHGMARTEIICARCDAHLGHVFDDGPPPTYKRYCINGIALKFVPYEKMRTEKTSFAAGCFWHVQEEFDKVRGVVKTTVGFSGGKTKAPTYKDVCSSDTGHAETILVEYDPAKVSYETLLDVFWKLHDPTQTNGQGVDVGAQYRSAIFYHNDVQKAAAIRSKDELQKSGKYSKKIVTLIEPAKEFYRAEDYHQKYMEKNRK